MKIEVNVRKKYAFLIASVIIVLAVALGVVAYNSNPGVPSNFGHSANELEVNIGGTTYTLQQAINQNLIGGDVSITNGEFSIYDYSTCKVVMAPSIRHGGTCDNANGYVAVGYTDEGTSSKGICCQLKDPSMVDFTTAYTPSSSNPCKYDEVAVGFDGTRGWDVVCAKRTGGSIPAAFCEKGLNAGTGVNKTCSPTHFYLGVSDTNAVDGLLCCPA